MLTWSDLVDVIVSAAILWLLLVDAGITGHIQHGTERFARQAVKLSFCSVSLESHCRRLSPVGPTAGSKISDACGNHHAEENDGGGDETDVEDDHRCTRLTVSATTSAAARATTSPMAWSLEVAIGMSVASFCSS